jgi:hypothetical protein
MKTALLNEDQSKSWSFSATSRASLEGEKDLSRNGSMALWILFDSLPLRCAWICFS